MKRALTIDLEDVKTQAFLPSTTQIRERGPELLVAAGNDREIVGHWLMEYRASPQTFRQYRKEAERLLLWLESRGEGLSEINRQTLDDFEQFLADPRPIADWIGPPCPRHSPQWRPFRHGLSAASRRQSLVILQTLFGWLVEAGWLRQNPFRLMRDKRRRLNNQQGGVERYIERPLWQWCWNRLNERPSSLASTRTHYEFERRRFIFAFAYLLAPRISEMSSARMNDFFQREQLWWWHVVGKGGKVAQVPVPDAMMTALGQWRLALGLSLTPAPDDDMPLLRALDKKRALGDNQLYRLIRQTFGQLSQARAQDDEQTQQDAQLLKRATPHWLRHTAITHQAQQGVELRYLARTARHSRLETTARYLHTEAHEWHGQINRHTLAVPDGDSDDAL